MTEAGPPQKHGREVKVGRFPFIGNGKAIALGDRGLVKTVFDAATGELLGAHMIGARFRTDPRLHRCPYAREPQKPN